LAAIENPPLMDLTTVRSVTGYQIPGTPCPWFPAGVPVVRRTNWAARDSYRRRRRYCRWPVVTCASANAVTGIMKIGGVPW